MHFGQTRGFGPPLLRGAHWWLQRSHRYPGTVMLIEAMWSSSLESGVNLPLAGMITRYYTTDVSFEMVSSGGLGGDA